MSLLKLALILGLLTGALFHVGVHSGQRASLNIGLIIHDSCEVVSGIVGTKDRSGVPRVVCALRHPFRLQRQDEAATSGTIEATSGPRSRSYEGVWLVEF
jgi:hypothetical protein